MYTKRTQGQVTIEYVLMLGSVLVILSAFLTTFHTDIAHWFFTFIGYALSK
ncbi:MAG: class III signal peptide-containing protein [Elusimicrobiaceae bacterium]|nr:class III signal peptide-containing protein [Elusimicrobiaceae bacterium]